MNYQELLRKYIEHVRQSEGCDYIDRLNDHTASDVKFSEEEVCGLIGLSIAPSTTWAEVFKRLPAEEQDRILGADRAHAYRQGRHDIERIKTTMGGPYSLEELRAQAATKP